MAVLFVAVSKGLTKWASDVGLTKHIFKIGLFEGKAKAAIEALNEAQYARESDWRLAGEMAGPEDDEATIFARLDAKEKAIDTDYYPRLKGTSGLFKVKPANVESHLLVRQALAGQEPKLVKIKSAEIVRYLLAIAGGKE
jgi:hypothetical protein